MANRRRGRVPAGALTVSAVAAGAAGLALERRHLRRLARDDDYARLSTKLDGRALTARSVDGTELHAQEFGPPGGDTVVLAHGWTEQLGFWRPVIERLAERGLRAVAYDLRGHGRSDPAVDHDYSLERFGEDLETVLGARQRATVVGHSLGAMSIAAWAEHHEVGARAKAAVLVNTGLGDLISGHLLFGQLAKWLKHPAASRVVLGSRARMPGVSSPLQQAAIRYMAFGPTATAGQVAFYERMLMDCSPDARAATGVALSDMNLHEAVSKLTVPTLVVAGDRDRLTPPAHARRIAETLPHLQALIELPDTGHMSPLERPQELTTALLQLIDEVSPQRAWRLPSPVRSGGEGF
ncbi:MAG TPA: alpha/beta fold hydrolase [Solirubrobacteraceae bacterium]|jgi:pimeloyl-ACP methyl ester carboxylesterase